MLRPYRLDLLRAETALSQEAVLTRPLLQVIRAQAVETPTPYPLGGRDPIISQRPQAIVDQRLIHATPNQLITDPDRPVATHHARAKKGLRVPDIALQTLSRERIHLRADQSRIITSSTQLFYEFRAAVFTPREQVDGLVSDLRRQAPDSSNAAVSPTFGRLKARILPSISAAISGCSFKKVRTLSLP